MATSPIYSWPEPDNTDLVKNGALAIRTLGNAIDTTMATMTPKSIVDAKGDLIAATANDTPARLAVGANGTSLVADSTQTTGLGWVATPSASNPVLNSAFNVWQRGTAVAQTTNGYGYTADRWSLWAQGTNNACTGSRQVTGDTTNLPFIQYCARVQRNSGQTGTSGVYFAQFMESVNSIPYAGKTVTFSFYARAGANFSAASSLLGVYLISGTGTDQNQYAGYTGQALPVNSTATLTTTWQRFTYTGNVASTATELAVEFGYVPVGTAGVSDFFEVTGVQIDIGNVALPFRTAGTTYQQELAACKRYFQVFGNSTLADRAFTTGVCYANNTLFAPLIFDEMRVSPTANVINGTIYDVVIGGTVVQTNLNALAFSNYTPRTAQIEVGSTATPFTAGHAGVIRLDNGIIIQLGAEL